MSSFFSSVELVPVDPILGLSQEFNNDTRPDKINLGVGVYQNEEGKVQSLRAICKAEAMYHRDVSPKGYLPIDGIPEYNEATQKLLLGCSSSAIQSGHAITVQTLGGTGALKIGADFLKSLSPNANVLISSPSWENHRALFENSGFPVYTYPYYDMSNRCLEFLGMVNTLKEALPGTIVVLHACCHNPTGIDPTPEQWRQIVDIIKEQRLVPFLDIAYQGFGTSLEEDSLVIRMFTSMGISLLISSSFSKSLALYNERVGALTIITNSRDESRCVLSQLKCIIRTNYSNPPNYGAALASIVLNSTELLQIWEAELETMRMRVSSMRYQLVQKIKRYSNNKYDWSFILSQRGIFSYTGLSRIQIRKLREKSAIYILTNGRVCMAALNKNNIDIVARSILETFQ